MSIPCIICQEVFNTDNDAIVLNRCGHIYHGSCLEEWKKSSHNKGSCPVCRKTYDKRSIRKLYFNVEEPEINAELSNEIKRQRILSENLVLHTEKLQKELLQKSMEVDKIKESWLQSSTELNKIKMDYGIKCQAYSIIDTVNNEYLQDNKRLKDENIKLKAEIEALRKQNSTIQMKNKEKSPKFVDLTNSNFDESDDDIQIIENSGKTEIIEIVDDESNDLETFKNQNKLNTPSKLVSNSCNMEQSPASSDESMMKSAKKLIENEDYKRFEDFILSQI